MCDDLYNAYLWVVQRALEKNLFVVFLKIRVIHGR